MPTRVQHQVDDDDDDSPAGSPPSPSLAIRRSSLDTNKRKRDDSVNGQPSRRQRFSVPDGMDDVFDPDQPLEERRILQRQYRELLREINEKREEYLGSESNGLHDTIRKADELAKKLHQTTDAAIDSRLLVSTSDLSYRKALRLAQGSLSTGIDAEDLVSKCIVYMRNGSGIADNDAPELSSTQRQRRGAPQGTEQQDGDEGEEIGDDGDMMNWAHLGRFACLPFLRRPALSGFLLGPLSVEKKARKLTQRSAPFRPNSLTETRPEVLNVDDLANKENDLTVLCGKILQQLQQKQVDAQETVAELIDDDMDDAEKTSMMHDHGLRSTGGLDLMRFVVNPKSFAQTVENMFYVSFLIRDGRIQVEMDEHDLPSLAPVDREVDTQATTRHSASKHQAVLSMDMQTWRDIIQAFNLTEPMIQHRQEVTSSGPGARGWYS
ncbi:hypothetical protein CDD80_1447 [Ophiocordyceps camponoti-rufipedis]|uniref:Non-structural maintenance of chromosomes element 4 n=1 Tax=Ophiocordyceps camponoti-rufipedis TaxID=2004952 RepID=A0A2C5ZBI3_9HYPO|nr:hypothetical protein CDD80_1447 [Ophiocordyceps camponoti-rufipedis]